MQKEKLTSQNYEFISVQEKILNQEINSEELTISDDLIQKWQKIVNTIAQIIDVPIALIMKVEPPYLEVICSNLSSENPYKIGEKQNWAGHYCKHVIISKKMLLVPNAKKDKQWDGNPDIKLGMISYLGFPLLWPDGRTFGTISVLDIKGNHYCDLYQELIGQFREFLESHLLLLWANHKLGILLINRKKLEEKLLQKEKYAVLGHVTKEVGHELQNPLGSIKNAVYLLNLIIESPTAEIVENLEILEKEVEASENLLNNFLNFSQPKPLNPCRVNINELLRNLLQRNFIPDNIEIATQLDENIPLIVADPVKLNLIFRNIISNANYAISEDGQVVIRTEIESPKWIAISFTDTGIGIPDENINLIFDPLFTTKAKGVGLGLPVAKILIEEHSGSIEFQSEMGKGTTFTIRLPINEKEEN